MPGGKDLKDSILKKHTMYAKEQSPKRHWLHGRTNLPESLMNSTKSMVTSLPLQRMKKNLFPKFIILKKGSPLQLLSEQHMMNGALHRLLKSWERQKITI